MKKTVLCSVLALSTTAAFADSEMVAATQKMNEQQSQQMKTMSPMNMVTLTSARPESDNGWYLFADALYWHADVGNTDWAVKTPDVLGQIVLQKDVHSLNFKWSWGFKAGLGVNIDHDMWDSNLYWTWFETDTSNGAGVSAGGVVHDNLGLFGSFTSGKIHWKIQYNMADWELGRWYYVSKYLALRPHVGVKGGWINQNIRLSFANNEQSYGSLGRFKNDFWGVGPSIGFNTMWVLGSAGKMLNHRFSLLGDFAGALMYGHFRVKHEQTFSSGGAVYRGYDVGGLTRNLAAAMFQGMMALSWDVPFNRDRNHFMMKVGYELQYWPRQNQIPWLQGDGSAVGYHRFSDDLMLQGVTAEFRFDF